MRERRGKVERNLVIGRSILFALMQRTTERAETKLWSTNTICELKRTWTHLYRGPERERERDREATNCDIH